MEFIPHSYQKTAIDLGLKSKYLALFQDPGLGKTVQILTILKELKLRALIIAPLDVIYRTWLKEIAKWDHTAGIKWAILHGPNKVQNFGKDAGIYLINPEGIKWLQGVVKTTKRWPFRVLVVDESTQFKNPQSKKFESLAGMVNNFDRRYILSGTPTTSKYLDIWSQYYLLDRGSRLFDNFYAYRNAFFYKSDYMGFKYDLFPNAKDRIHDLVKDITIYIAGNDHLDLPEIVINDIEIRLPTIARNAYRDMARELAVEFDDGFIATAANAAVKTQRLQCISNGFLYSSAKNPLTGKVERTGTKDIHDEKINALTSLVNELNGNPLLVGFHYQQDLVKLLRAFPGTPYFGSGKTQEEKIEIERDWNSGKIPLLFAQIHSTARGLNLQESGYNIAFYSMTWSFEDYDQFIKRIARQGQASKRVFVHRFIGHNTIDKVILETLGNRRNQLDEFFNTIKLHIKESAL